jgi:hypothetical protein
VAVRKSLATDAGLVALMYWSIESGRAGALTKLRGAY